MIEMVKFMHGKEQLFLGSIPGFPFGEQIGKYDLKNFDPY